MITVSGLRQDAAAVLEEVRADRGPVVITQRGRAAAVLLSVAEYERSAQQLALLRALTLGEREIRAGRGHDLDDVFAEADELLASPA
jgi:prevent-host-death family protein